MRSRVRVGEVLAPAGETEHDREQADRTAPTADGPAEEASSKPEAAKTKSHVPVWREGSAWSADYQRILTALADRIRLGQGPMTCQEMAALFGMDVVPARVEALRSKSPRAHGGARP